MPSKIEHLDSSFFGSHGFLAETAPSNLAHSPYQTIIHQIELVVPPGFEPGSPGPKPEMMDHYTTGLWPTVECFRFGLDAARSRRYQEFPRSRKGNG